MYNVLICDDDKDIVNALKIYLSGGDSAALATRGGQRMENPVC